MAESANPGGGSKSASGSQEGAETKPPANSKDPVIDAKTFSLSLPEGAGHKGTLTVNDNAPIESTILAYRVIHRLARHISERVIGLNQNKRPVFFHNAADFVALRDLRACVALCDEYTRFFEKLIAEGRKELPPSLVGEDGEVKLWAGAAVTAFAVFSGLLSSGLQLLSLFRTDQEIKSYKIEVEDQVLAMTVAGYLKQDAKFEIFASTIVPVDPLHKSEFMSSLHALNKQRDVLSSLLDQLADKTDSTQKDDDQKRPPTASKKNAGAADEQLTEDEGSMDEPSNIDYREDIAASLKENGDQTTAEPLRQVIGDRISRKTARDSSGDAAPKGPSARRAALRGKITDALKDFDAFQQSLCKVDDKSGSTLSRVLTGESLAARLKEGGVLCMGQSRCRRRNVSCAHFD